MESLIKAEGICKSFGTSMVLKNLFFEVAPGEIRGLVGENGAGKATLLNVLEGVLRRDDGVVHKKGEKINLHSIIDAYNHRIGFILQEQGMFPCLSVSENFYLGKDKAFKRFGNMGLPTFLPL